MSKLHLGHVIYVQESNTHMVRTYCINPFEGSHEAYQSLCNRMWNPEQTTWPFFNENNGSRRNWHNLVIPAHLLPRALHNTCVTCWRRYIRAIEQHAIDHHIEIADLPAMSPELARAIGAATHESIARASLLAVPVPKLAHYLELD